MKNAKMTEQELNQVAGGTIKETMDMVDYVRGLMKQENPFGKGKNLMRDVEILKDILKNRCSILMEDEYGKKANKYTWVGQENGKKVTKSLTAAEVKERFLADHSIAF